MPKKTLLVTHNRLPPQVASAARALNLAPEEIRTFAVRANGEVVVIDLNGRKYVTAVQKSGRAAE